MLGHKKCTRCHESKKLEEFSLRGLKYPNKRVARCKTCLASITRDNYRKHYHLIEKQKYLDNPIKAREDHIKRKYGISPEEYNKLAEFQQYRCAVCHQPETKINKKTGKLHSLSIDHCHTTGKVRGLLCDNCNRAEGFLKSDPELIRKLADYLEKNKD